MNESENHIQNDVQLTVVIPVFQEAKIIRNSLNHLYRIINDLHYRFEIIVADDGSSDHCNRIVSNMKDKFRNLRFVRYPFNMGRGFILTKAIERSRGNIICYIDADLQIDPEVLSRLVQCIEDGFDIVLGSKYHPDSQLSYSRWRRIQSIIYNKVTRHVLNVNIQDFQCGAKAFKRTTILDLLKHLTCKGWSWDTELILKATILGYSLAEIPVIVRPNLNRRSRVRVKSILAMSWHLISLWVWSKREAKIFVKKNKSGYN